MLNRDDHQMGQDIRHPVPRKKSGLPHPTGFNTLLPYFTSLLPPEFHDQGTNTHNQVVQHYLLRAGEEI